MLCRTYLAYILYVFIVYCATAFNPLGAKMSILTWVCPHKPLIKMCDSKAYYVVSLSNLVSSLYSNISILYTTHICFDIYSLIWYFYLQICMCPELKNIMFLTDIYIQDN